LGRWRECNTVGAGLFENYGEGEGVELLAAKTVEFNHAEEVAADFAEQSVAVLAADVDEHWATN
jgi:hypothetical protein